MTDNRPPDLRVVGKSDLSERFIVIECRDASARARFSKLLVAATELLALAKQLASECSGCMGSGKVQQYTADHQPLAEESCPDCADIREVISKAEAGCER